MRAPVKWFGGKGKMISRILPLIPRGGIYVEPFCGVASLFFAKRPSPVEVLNDLDGRLINLFRCLQEPKSFDELKHRLRYTLYARSEFVRAIEIVKSGSGSLVEQAWAFFVCRN